MFIIKKKFNAKINQAFIKGIWYGIKLKEQQTFERNNSANDIRKKYMIDEKERNLFLEINGLKEENQALKKQRYADEFTIARKCEIIAEFEKRYGRLNFENE